MGQCLMGRGLGETARGYSELPSPPRVIVSMAKSPKLKVFRTAIGFHDAYVAAPSMKAALEAWGASRNLFASGAAEPVTDDALAAPALAQPGVVLKVLRGTPAEQIAALGKPRQPQRAVAVRRKQAPRPSRTGLDEAEAALDALAASHRQAEDEVAREEAALKKRRAALQKSQERERRAAEQGRAAHWGRAHSR